jgi:hypothetical protein
MFRDAQQPFLELLEELRPRPRRIIVLGKTMWSNMPVCSLYRHKDLQAYRLADRSRLDFVEPRGGHVLRLQNANNCALRLLRRMSPLVGRPSRSAAFTTTGWAKYHPCWRLARRGCAK